MLAPTKLLIYWQDLCVMCAEADGDLSILIVGNTEVNRVISNCLDFGDIRNIRDMVFQSPGDLKLHRKDIFINGHVSNKPLASQTIQREQQHLSSNALWLFQPEENCPGITSRAQVDIKRIVFTPLPKLIVRPCIDERAIY